MALPDKIQQLDERIAVAVRGALAGLREEIGDRLRQSSAAIEERLENLESTLGGPLLAADDLQPLADEAATSGRRDAFASICRALASLDRGASQTEVLGSLLQATGRFASRSALFLTLSEEVRGWGSFGFSDSEQAVAGLRFDYEQGSPWARLVEGRGVVTLSAAECARVSSRLESQVPRHAVLIPLLLGNRLAAALYADRVADDQRLEVEALQSLAYTASLALATLPLRQGVAAPTLTPADEAGAEHPLALWQAAAVDLEAPAGAPPAAPPAPPPAPAEEEEPQEEALSAFEAAEVEIEEEGLEGAEREELAAEDEEEVPTWERPTQELTKEVSAASAALDEAPAATPATQELPRQEPEEPASTPETPAWTAAEEPSRHEPEKPAWTVETPAWTEEEAPSWTDDEDTAVEAEAPAAETAVPVEGGPGEEVAMEALPQIEETYEPEEAPAPPEAVAGAEPVPLERDVSEDETVFLRRSPPPVEPTSPPEAEADSPPRAAGPAEVQPPGDFTGPGLAFGASRPAADDAALHEEGRRLARLLVSEIRLYNEEEVEEGKRNRDLYARLREEIDRSRKMYEERIDDRVRASRDYFAEELVRILADGDAGVLGNGDFSP